MNSNDFESVTKDLSVKGATPRKNKKGKVQQVDQRMVPVPIPTLKGSFFSSYPLLQNKVTGIYEHTSAEEKFLKVDERGEPYFGKTPDWLTLDYIEELIGRYRDRSLGSGRLYIPRYLLRLGIPYPDDIILWDLLITVDSSKSLLEILGPALGLHLEPVEVSKRNEKVWLSSFRHRTPSIVGKSRNQLLQEYIPKQGGRFELPKGFIISPEMKVPICARNDQTWWTVTWKAFDRINAHVETCHGCNYCVSLMRS